MASVSKVSILDYFNIVFEGENGKIESNCKACGTRIQAKRSVTSNFVTHLKVTISTSNDVSLALNVRGQIIQLVLSPPSSCANLPCRFSALTFSTHSLQSALPSG